MDRNSVYLVILSGLISAASVAGEMSVEDQLTEANMKIEEEEEINLNLKEEVTTREEEIQQLKEKLKELEEQIGD